jgi:parallel beta-helix repeat protein
MNSRSRTTGMKTLSFVIMFVLLASMFIPVAQASGDVQAVQIGAPKTSDIPITAPLDDRSPSVTDVNPPTINLYYPVIIGSDAELAAFASANGYPGSGSADDPFLFNGLYIYLNYYTYGSALVIKDTTSHFTISNSSFNYAKYSSAPYQIGAGILLSNVQNGQIENCQISSCIVGIKIMESSDLLIRGTYISPDYYTGICLDMQNSHDIMVFGNTFQSGYNNPYGVKMVSCTASTFEENSFSGRSAHLESSDGNFFFNNTWSNMYDYGLDLRSSDANIIQGNTFNYAQNSNVNSIESLNNRYLGGSIFGTPQAPK